MSAPFVPATATPVPVVPLSNEEVLRAAKSMLQEAWLHSKTEESIANAVLGMVHSPRLSVTAIGTAWAQATGHEEKHGVKQVDRLVSNGNFHLPDCARAYVRAVVGGRTSLIVALDWTEFALDGHSTISLSLVTRHGRTTPLVWKTVESSALKERRNWYEDELLHFFKECLPKDRKLRVVVLADRGFGDVALYAELEEELGFDFVIRFRGNVLVKDAASGKRQRADAWLAEAGGRQVRLVRPRLTGRPREVRTFVGVHEEGMKDAWYLASSLPGSVKALVKLYGRRFSCEETFMHSKDMRFGWGLYDTQVTQTERRDRLLFIAAMAQLILTLLGAAGEELGLDKKLRVNTVKKRTRSLLRQGREYLKGRVARVAEQLHTRFHQLLAALSLNRDELAII
jgi:hypothetical protein